MKKILVGLLFICFFNICSSTKVNAVHLDVQQSRLFNSLLVRVKQRPLQYLKKVQTKEISVNAPLLLTQIFRKNLNDFRLAVDKSNDSTSQCVESGKAISQKREEYGIWSEALLKFESNFIDILNSYFQQERELIAEILRQAEEIQNF
ncbi:MAG: hypothetical protein LBL38_00200 [Lactobacillales bacterium]|nr:hypothetical protein [Lactobacillales bacterium]